MGTRTVRASMAAAAGYAAAAAIWAARGAALPGGRLLAVHLFTLGVMTNLIGALMPHFGRALTHARPGTARAIVPNAATRNTGIALLLAGTATGWTPLRALGGTILLVDIAALGLSLRRMRARALMPRFPFVLIAYERACLAFVAAGLFGVLMGLGRLDAHWYLGARLLHVHLMLLGWGGLSVLATLVFLGPTIVRAPMERGADATAARALRRCALGLTIAAPALLAGGFAGPAGLGARVLAASGITIYALSAAGILRGVARAAARSSRFGAEYFVGATCLWFAVACALDVAGLLADRWSLLTAAGVVLLVGSLAQAILASALHLLPVLWSTSFETHGQAITSVHRGLRVRALALNAGTALIALGVSVPGRAHDAATAGWLLVLAAITASLGIGVGTAWRCRAGKARNAANAEKEPVSCPS